MAGKADIVNGIVDRDASYIKTPPIVDGWGGTAQAEDEEWPYASLSSGSELGDGSVRVGVGGGGQG